MSRVINKISSIILIGIADKPFWNNFEIIFCGGNLFGSVSTFLHACWGIVVKLWSILTDYLFLSINIMGDRSAMLL